MRVNGFEQGLERQYVAGLRIDEQDYTLLAQVATTPEESELIQSYIPEESTYVDVATADSRRFVATMQTYLDHGESRSTRLGLVATLNNVEGTSLLVDRYVKNFIDDKQTGIVRARAILRGCERIMRRPDLLTRPL